MHLNRIVVDLLLAGVSALLLVLIFPGFNFSFLAWFALVPLLMVIKRQTPGKAFLFSFGAGFVFLAGLLWWNLHIGGFNPINFSLSIMGLAAYIGGFGFLARYFYQKLPQWTALVLPAAWVLLEYLHSHLSFLSTPWGILGYSQYNVLPVARIAAYTGVYGVSFLIVVVNVLLADFISARFSRTPENSLRDPGTIGALFVLLFSISVSLSPTAQAGESASSLRASAIQGGIYWFASKNPALQKQVFTTYHALTMNASQEKPEIIIWPSSTVPGHIPYDHDLVRSLAGLSRKAGAYLLVGSAGFDKLSTSNDQVKRVSNSAFLFSPEGKIIGQYDKRKLLPFDEYLPLREYVKWPSWIVSDMIDSRPGDKLTVFDMGKAKFSVQICWENYFPEQFREIVSQNVDFMVTMTNDAFVDVPAANYQMLAMTVFRAIENHVSVIRVSTSGVSGIIDPGGRIQSTVHDENGLEVDVIGKLTDQVPLSATRTLYTRHGDWLISGLAILLFYSLLFSLQKPSITVSDRNYDLRKKK